VTLGEKVGRQKVVVITPARTAEHYQWANTLFTRYAESLDFDLEFQNFTLELENLPGDYAPPSGCILLAEYSGNCVGCVALRPLDDSICEMKRLYVLPEFRGKHIGYALANAIIAEAKHIGYRRMRLDTVASMSSARSLYAQLGFYSIAAYCYNPLADAAYMELRLG